MLTNHTLKNTTRPKKARKRVGRGSGSKLGKTCGRGEKGMGSRSGFQKRLGYEGGQMRLHMKLPKRGFSRARFQKKPDAINLGLIEEHFNAGDEVSYETLKARGLIRGSGNGLKILGDGEISKKVRIIANAVTASAQEKIERAKIELKLA